MISLLRSRDIRRYAPCDIYRFAVCDIYRFAVCDICRIRGMRYVPHCGTRYVRLCRTGIRTSRKAKFFSEVLKCHPMDLVEF